MNGGQVQVDSTASRHRLKYAIVIKGPLVAFTRACMGHYLATMPGVGVVFSHNRGCAGSAAQQPTLEELQSRYPATFGFVLAEPPLELGIGFRNVQREAVYHGVRHAIELWRPRWVLVHRPDAGFVQPRQWIWSLNKGGPGTTVPLHGEPGLNVMERLAAVALAQPPVVFSSRVADGSRRQNMPPLSRRLGVCPFQMHLTTFYGHYTVDDHCMFGLAHDVLAFWSLAPPYCRECVSSSELDPDVLALPRKRLCRKPGTEQENGILWVEWMMREGWAPPNTTLKLLEQQLWVLNPLPFGYVRFTKTTANRTVKFPLEGDPTISGSVVSASLFGRYAHLQQSNRKHDLFRVCRPLPSRATLPVWKSADDWKAPVYDCSHVRNDPSDPKHGVVAKGGLGLTVLSDWVCPDPMKERHPNPEQDWKVECGRMGPATPTV
jgi:hypothetical protein